MAKMQLFITFFFDLAPYCCSQKIPEIITNWLVLCSFLQKRYLKMPKKNSQCHSHISHFIPLSWKKEHLVFNVYKKSYSFYVSSRHINSWISLTISSDLCSWISSSSSMNLHRPRWPSCIIDVSKNWTKNLQTESKKFIFIQYPIFIRETIFHFLFSQKY